MLTNIEKAPTPVIGIEALRTIHRIVLAIREKIAASERTKPENGDLPCSAADPGGSRTINSNSGTDNNERRGTPMKNTQLVTQTHPLITPDHLRRLAVIYIRQTTEEQVRENTGSTDFQRSLPTWHDPMDGRIAQIEIIDEDLGRSGSSSELRTGWQRLNSEIAAGQVGIVLVATISRLSRQVL